MRDKIFLDTNILVYLSNEESYFHEKTLKIFNQIVGKYDIWISRQVLREYAVVMSRQEFYGKTLTSQEIVEDIEKWEKSFNVIDETKETTDNLKKLLAKYEIKGKQIHDANIVASMINYSIPLVFTFNIKDFQVFEEIEIMKIQP
ncbi:MAG TPA: type II toxin-antitoxin system VapC family toxin [Candidatus Deferrimicrobium sp.]|nr:type II toxin-antitoxin system VapC family toxin [Candidatus Kapabacteria bacterium]HLP62741.1 type II toxin-antitoxin system VapC family toxin [Candidatus Deferrimicrobium sp.]